jgi:RNA polymerase sigma-70 factor (ECF subfamily)
MDQQTISSLVRRAQAFDNDACVEIFREFYPFVFAIILRTLRRTRDAEEMTYEVIGKAILKSGKLRNELAFAGWIKNIAINEASRKIIPKKKDLCLPLLDYDQAVDPGHPTDELIREEQTDLVWQAMNRLADRHRDILVDFYFKGLTIKDLVAKYQIPKGTAKRRLHTARKKMRDELLILADLEEIIF